MDDTTNSPGPAGGATLTHIEACIISTRAAAHTVSLLLEEAFDSPHPDAAARRHEGIALLLDVITYTGLTASTLDLLRHVHAAHDAVRSAVAAGGAR